MSLGGSTVLSFPRKPEARGRSFRPRPNRSGPGERALLGEGTGVNQIS